MCLKADYSLNLMTYNNVFIYSHYKGETTDEGHVFCYFRVVVDEIDGWYHVDTRKPSGWAHVVMAYHGVGQGITEYVDGSQIGTDTSKQSGHNGMGTGQVSIGRRVFSGGSTYASVHVDELRMYNKKLSPEEIAKMY